MNEGYSLGWRQEENEYIDNFEKMMEKYDSTVKEIKELDKQIDNLNKSIERRTNTIDENNESFQTIDRTLEEGLNSRKNELESELERVKAETRQKIAEEKLELERKLEQLKKDSQMLSINYNLAHSEEEKSNIRKKYDEIMIEIRKIQDALDYYETLSKELEGAKAIEVNVPFESTSSVNVSIPQLEEQQEVEDITPVDPDEIEQPKIIAEENLNPGETFDERIASYLEKLEVYKSLARSYNDTLDGFNALKGRAERGEITEEEYNERVQGITDLYDYVNSEYEKVRDDYYKLKEDIEKDIENFEIEIEDLERLQGLAENFDDEDMKQRIEDAKKKLDKRRAIELEAPIGPQEPVTDLELQREHGEDEAWDEPLRVVDVTPWQWVKEHKKQILIALGIAALAIATIILVTQVLPAVMAAVQATQVSNLYGAMAANGAKWFTASATEQVALHGANTALASQIAQITGVAANYVGATGAWTMGGQSLAAAASTAATNAAAAQAALGGLKAATLISGLGGLGLLGGGLLSHNHSVTYLNINRDIKTFKTNYDYYTDEDFVALAHNINNDILRSPDLSSDERRVLSRKLNNVLKKRRHLFEAGYKQPVVERQPVSDSVPSEEPTIVEPTIEEPIEVPTIEEPSIEEPKNDEPSIEEPSIEEPKVEEPTIVEPDSEEISEEDFYGFGKGI